MKRNKRINCWEFKKCGRQPEGKHSSVLGICPAATTKSLDSLHGGKNGGRACWFVVGTLCNGEVQGTFAKKYKSCIYCDFFKRVKEEYSKYSGYSIDMMYRHRAVEPACAHTGSLHNIEEMSAP